VWNIVAAQSNLPAYNDISDQGGQNNGFILSSVLEAKRKSLQNLVSSSPFGGSFRKREIKGFLNIRKVTIQVASLIQGSTGLLGPDTSCLFKRFRGGTPSVGFVYMFLP
jgi:hypothetical protein